MYMISSKFKAVALRAIRTSYVCSFKTYHTHTESIANPVATVNAISGQ